MIEEPVLHAQLLACGFFLGWWVNTPAGSYPASPCPVERGMGRIGYLLLIGCFLVVLFAGHGRSREITLSVARSPARGSSPSAFSSCRCTAPAAVRHWWTLATTLRAVDGHSRAPSSARGLVATRLASRSGAIPERRRPVARRAASDASNSGLRLAQLEL